MAELPKEKEISQNCFVKEQENFDKNHNFVKNYICLKQKCHK